MQVRALDAVVGAVFGRRFPRWDAFMVALAVVDVAALALRRELPLPEPWPWRLLVLDWLLLGFFTGEWLVGLARSTARARYARATAYDLVALLPLPMPALRALRLLRIPHVLLWGARDPAEAERHWGGPYALHVVRRHERVLIEDLTDPVLVRLLVVVREAVAKGRYAQAVGEALDQRRDRLRAVVRDTLEARPALRLALLAPGAGRAVDLAQDQLVDLLVDLLVHPDLDAVLRESIDAALADLQARIAETDHAVPAPS